MARLNLSHPLSNGLVGAWMMKEGSGLSVYDISGNGATETFNGGVTWVPSQTGSALNFNGSNGYLSGSDTALPSGTSPSTFSCWFYINAFPGGNYADLCSWGRPGNASGAVNLQERIFLYSQHSGPWLIAYSSYGDVFDGSTTLTTGKWYHYVCTISGSGANGVKLYLNGNFEGQGTSNLNTVLAYLKLGCRTDGDNGQTEFGNEIIDNVLIYNRALSAAEITQLYFDPFCMTIERRHTMLSAARPITIAGTGGAISEFAISDQPISGSPAGGIIYNNSLAETVTATDSDIILATNSSVLTENATETDSYSSTSIGVSVRSDSQTATDSIAGAATGLTNLNETGSVTDQHLGIASDLMTLTETDTETDSYTGTQLGNVITETVTESDSLAIAATDSDVITETIAANDNYDSILIPLGGTVIPTGSGGDPWERYLLWLERKKRKQFKRRAENANIPVKKANEIAKIASEQVKREEIQLKTPYYAAIHLDEKLARHTAQIAINQIYEAVWEAKVRDAVKKQREG